MCAWLHGGCVSLLLLLLVVCVVLIAVVCCCLLQAVPESLLMLHGLAADEGGSGDAGLFLHAGLSNGVLQRTEVDRITGACRGMDFSSELNAYTRT